MTAAIRQLDRIPPRALLLVTLITIVAVLGLSQWSYVRAIDNWLGDVRLVRFSPSADISQHVVVIAIDEDTLAGFAYRTPVDRGFLADLVTTLDSLEPRAIGLDLLLDQATEQEKDRRLRNVLLRARAPIIVASATRDDGLTERQVAFQTAFIEGVDTGTPLVDQDAADATVRRLPLEDMNGRATFIARVALASGLETPRTSAMGLNYAPASEGARAPFPIHPASLVAGALPKEWIRNRIVLIGIDLPLEDRHRTPFTALGVPEQDTMSGVFVHAYALQQLADRAPTRFASHLSSILLLMTAALLGVVLAVRTRSVSMFLLTQLLVSTCFVLTAFWISSLGGTILRVLPPLLALMISGGLIMTLRWAAARKRSVFLRDAFSRFVPPGVVDELIENPESLKLGGERRELTFLFTDVAGFTGLTEQVSPELLVDVLNEYLDGVSRIASEHGGTIDKIVGDALHVMFNAPMWQPDHAARAVRCSLAIDSFCQDFREHMRERGVTFGMTRIGVNSGETVIGNMGGSTRFDYTALGDAINVAARLESANRYLGTRICVGARTVELSEELSFRPIGELLLKGKSTTIEVFEPVTTMHPATMIERYDMGYRRLKAGERAAEEIFSSLAANYPDDKLIALHAGRLAAGESGTVIVLAEK